MDITKARFIFGLILITIPLLTISIIALYPVLSGEDIKVLGAYTDHLKTYGSFLTGFIGLIVGFYFGQKN